MWGICVRITAGVVVLAAVVVAVVALWMQRSLLQWLQRLQVGFSFCIRVMQG